MESNIERVKGPSVKEIHIDFLLWEELEVNEIFLAKFIEACVGADDFDSLLNIEHSLSDHLGESDLVLRYRSKSSEFVGILIEDKIGAGFQPDQAERYMKRGEIGKSKLWERFITCLVAPERYINKGHKFMTAVSLELMSEWIDVPEPRAQFKIAVLKSAINKEQHTGAQQIDEIITNFRIKYFELLKQSKTKLSMNYPKPSWKGETWFRLKHPSLPNKLYIHHKADRGFVDLTFPKVNAADMLKIGLQLEHDMNIEQTGKSTSIRIISPAIDDFNNFEEKIDQLQATFQTAMRLVDFYLIERVKLMTLIL